MFLLSKIKDLFKNKNKKQTEKKEEIYQFELVRKRYRV